MSRILHIVQLVHKLKIIDHPMRFCFAKWAWNRLTKNADIGNKKSSFQMKLIFNLRGYINQQNCSIWGRENLSTQPKRVTVWCGFWSGGIIGQFFIKYEQGVAVAVNGDRYRTMLSEFLFALKRRIWFQQDGATCHTAEATYTRCFKPGF